MVKSIVSRMCAFGMMGKHNEGALGFIKKPTRFMSNSAAVMQHLDRRCSDDHGHVTLMGRDRTPKAAIYP